MRTYSRIYSRHGAEGRQPQPVGIHAAFSALGDPRRLPVIFGIVLAIVAIGAEAFLSIAPPNSYGVCLVCHTMDSINWVSNRLFHTTFQVQPSSRELPLVTPFAILIGGVIASLIFREWRLKVAGSVLPMFLLGFTVMSIALISMGCPIRLTLLVAYGDGMALFSLVGVIIGAAAGTFVLRRRYRR
jgi:hypothetical protein